MDRTKFQYEGIKWLFELELLNHPQVINTIKLNILMVSKRVKEVELLIYRENKSMLVLLDLTWIGTKFFKQRIFNEVQESLTQLLPNFRTRITDDPKIMELAVNKVKQALTGGKDEKNYNLNNPTSVQHGPQLDSPRISKDGTPSDNISDPQEQSDVGSTVHEEASSNNTLKE